jgi:hypothetical protein
MGNCATAEAFRSRFAYAHPDAINAILRGIATIGCVIHAGHPTRASDAIGAAAGLFHFADRRSRDAKAWTVHSIFCWIALVCRVVDTSHPAGAGNRAWSSTGLLRDFRGFSISLPPLRLCAPLILGNGTHPACKGKDERSEGDKMIPGFQVNFHRILLGFWGEQECKNSFSNYLYLWKMAGKVWEELRKACERTHLFYGKPLDILCAIPRTFTPRFVAQSSSSPMPGRREGMNRNHVIKISGIGS